MTIFSPRPDTVKIRKLRTKNQLIALGTGQATSRLDAKNDLDAKAIDTFDNSGTFTFIYTYSEETTW